MIAQLTFPERIERQTRERPDHPAIVTATGSMSYQEFNARANAVAHFLVAQGVTHATRIGLAMQRGADQAETLVYLLAILKVGTLVPLVLPPDAELYPVERFTSIVEDAGITHIVTHERFASRLARVVSCTHAVLVPLDTLQEKGDLAWTANPLPPQPSDLAYILYTTGTTGCPKGVMIEHASLGHFAQVQTALFSLGPEDRMPQFFSLSFDACFSELIALAVGATLYPVPLEALYVPSAFARFLSTHRITAAVLTPTLGYALPTERLPDLRLVVFGGEMVHAPLVQRWMQQNRCVVNSYGLTETTVACTWHVCSTEERVPAIGRAFPGMQVTIRDAVTHLPVPDGTPGELCVAGHCLARGYTNAALTCERFIDDPDPHQSGQRLFLTQDQGVMTLQGHIQYLGRINTRRLKLRGSLLVELDEIAYHLSERGDIVKEVAVEVLQGRLVAFLTLSADFISRQAGAPLGEQTALREREAIKALQEHLAQRVPTYMHPKAFVFLAQIPRNESDKVDREALQRILVDWRRLINRGSFRGARTPVEKQLAAIIAALLNEGEQQIQAMAALFAALPGKAEEGNPSPPHDGIACTWETIDMHSTPAELGIDSLNAEVCMLRIQQAYGAVISATEIHTPLVLIAEAVEDHVATRTTTMTG